MFCHAMWGLEGNKDPELPAEVRHRRDLVLLEDRMFGESVKIPMVYSTDTGLLREVLTVGD